MLGRHDHGFVFIKEIALNAAISGSILAEPGACLVMTMALRHASVARHMAMFGLCGTDSGGIAIRQGDVFRYVEGGGDQPSCGSGKVRMAPG